jgi:hypothetical protein
MRRNFWVARCPAFESGKRILFALRAADLDQRMLRRTAPRRLHARRFIGSFLVLRRPWRVAQTIALMLRGQFEEAGERARMLVDALMPVTQLGEARKHRRESEVAGLAVVDFVPG